MPLRGPEHDESLGMDSIYHGEEAYPSGEGAILVTAEAGERGSGAGGAALAESQNRHYSYASAWRTSSRAARRAGAIAATTPANAATTRMKTSWPTG